MPILKRINQWSNDRARRSADFWREKDLTYKAISAADYKAALDRRGCKLKRDNVVETIHKCAGDTFMDSARYYAAVNTNAGRQFFVVTGVSSDQQDLYGTRPKRKAERRAKPKRVRKAG